MRMYFLLSFLFFSIITYSQEELPNNTDKGEKLTQLRNSNEKDSLEIYNPILDDYQFWTEKSPKQNIDTAQTIYNYLKYKHFDNKDGFGKMFMSNKGQPYNPILFEDRNNELLLLPFGKSNFHQSINEVKYYDVKTPMTSFAYHNGIKEGHILNTTFTHNLHLRFNYAFQYRGLRSLSKYLNSLTANNNLTFSVNYRTKNERYKLLSHFTNENIDQDESGGVSNPAFFESGEKNYRARNRLETNLNDAKSEYDYRRYYLSQEFGLIQSITKDSIAYFPISIKNRFSYETLEYIYTDRSNDTYYINKEGFSLLFPNIERRGSKRNKKLSNIFSAQFNWSDRLNFEAGLKFDNIKYINPSERIISTLLIPQTIEDNRLGIVGSLNFSWSNKLKLWADAEFMNGNFFKTTYNIKGKLFFEPLKNYPLEGDFGIKSVTPSINFLMNQSQYAQANYFLSNFNNEEIQTIRAKLNVEKFKTSFSAKFYNINNYTYINKEFQPTQSTSTTSLFQLQLNNDIGYKKFHLNTRVAYQKVSSNAEILPLPEFIGNATLYYEDVLFKKATHIQTGINVYYFSKFNSNMYYPIINEFKLNSNTSQQIGAYPLLDLFLNVKVKTMRIYIEAQHFNSSFTGYNYFASPNYPYVDFRLNIGIVWFLLT